MNKNCKMTIGAMLLLTTAFSAFSVNAQTCAVPPTCESLGYDKSADECSGLAQLKCPFDQSKYFCTAYRNAGEGEPIAVGDIAYSDGTYSAVPIPTKIPVGVVYSTSGQIVALSPYKTNVDPGSGLSATACQSFTTNGKNGWTNPTLEELQSVYANRSKVETTLATLSATPLGTEKYIYDVSSYCPDYLVFATGKTDNCSNGAVLRCVNTLAKIAGGTTTTYKVGDTYVKDGVALGTVVSVDSTGQHGTVALSGGSATATDASLACSAKTIGGLNWTLASGEHACLIVKNAGTLSDCGYSSFAKITCGMHSTSAPGACNNSKWNVCANATGAKRTSCAATDVLSYVCEAPF